MARRPMWAMECLDLEEAELLLQDAPEGSHIEEIVKDAGSFVLLWVPVPNDVIEAELGHNPWGLDAASFAE